MMLIRKIYYSLPLPLRSLSRRIVSLPADIKYYLTQPKDAMHPPKGKILIGSGDFLEQGKHQLALLQKYTGLQPGHQVLDIGCGQGRTAVALTSYLDNNATYEGIDIMLAAIDWCKERIHSKHSNFRFQRIQAYNKLYQENSSATDGIELPFPENHFNCCFLFSVFTHLTGSAVRDYLSEICRVLRPGELCLCTMFIYDEATEQYISDKNNGMRFPNERDGFRLMNQNIEEANVAYNKKTLKLMVEEAELKITNYVDGFWKDWINRTTENSFQDIVILRKP